MHSGDTPRVVVIGVGNTLCSDEGVGVHVVNKLERMMLDSKIEVFDCGTNGFAVLEAMDGADKAIIIDATSSGKEPGTIQLYTMEDLLRMEERTFKLVSLHQFDLLATLKLGEMTSAYRIPRKVVIIGVEAKSTEYSSELSNEVKNAVPRIIEAIVRETQVVG
jgi:hydrogenase maturation protease